ncbi:MAG: phosphate acyltransferase PlsX [Clostridiales bacterium]|nr:phosphate acyltransferase PlsX [Clostridiales bacterium]
MIVVDAMGGDNAPSEIVKGCIDGVDQFGLDEIMLVGRSENIKEILNNEGADLSKYHILDAKDIIYTEDVPVTAIRRKRDSSMVRGLEYVRNNPGSVFVSAGNTGALMAGGLLRVGRIKGIDRPALAPVIPTLEGEMLLIDAGANVDCKVENLVQFGIIGSIYMERVRDKNRPRVGLLNIGTEETKGNELTKAAFHEMSPLENINFIGNVEAREVLSGAVDVLVCDGFVGNVVLKLIEGVAQSMFAMIRTEVEKSTMTKIGAGLAKPAFRNIRDSMDYTKYGGAPLLGVKGGVIKMHGSSNREAVKNALFQAMQFMKRDIVGTTTEQIAKLEGDIK